MKYLILLTLLSFSTILPAAKFSEAEINALVTKPEAQLLAWLRKEGKSPAEITKYYLNAAEQAYMLHQNSVAKVLYKKALKRKDIENKLVAYLPMIEMEIQGDKISDAKKIFQEAETYLKANPALNNQPTQERMTVFKLQISQRPSEEALTQGERESIQMTHSTQMVYSHDLKQYLISKNYEKAFKLIEGQDFTESNVNSQILADVVYTGAKKPRESLYCKKDYDHFPEARDTSYSMKLCGVLLGIQSGSKINEKDFRDLKNLLKSDYPENLYLEQVARDLASKK
ncbi:MAG: hypothetical protein A2X86_18995 [Bdellovibrionales bacterium GWA2_49_15]|nr:MAG: hypothetical protein A2X86_18995 [Bdellovibrionales bacterium GWA2_49_15]HAZ14314.1 hypothetical protein [Bdellovibrionales bacterium]